MTGVVNYDFGNYQVVATQAFTVAQASTLGKETGTLTGDADHLLVASYNAENLDPRRRRQRASTRSRQEILEQISTPPTSLRCRKSRTTTAPRTRRVTSATSRSRCWWTRSTRSRARGRALLRSSTIRSSATTPTAASPAATSAPPSSTAPTVSISSRVAAHGRGRRHRHQRSRPATPTSRPIPTTRSSPRARRWSPPSVQWRGGHDHQQSLHLRGGSAPLLGADQPPFAAGEVQRPARRRRSIHSSTASWRDPNANVIVAGDLNEFRSRSRCSVMRGTATITDYDVPGSDPFNAIADYTAGGTAVLSDLMELLPADEQYDYVFEGNSQTLDHVLRHPRPLRRRGIRRRPHQFRVRRPDQRPRPAVGAIRDRGDIRHLYAADPACVGLRGRPRCRRPGRQFRRHRRLPGGDPHQLDHPLVGRQLPAQPVLQRGRRPVDGGGVRDCVRGLLQSRAGHAEPRGQRRPRRHRDPQHHRRPDLGDRQPRVRRRDARIPEHHRAHQQHHRCCRRLDRTQFPYLSANTDFSGDPNLSPLFTATIQNANATTHPTASSRARRLASRRTGSRPRPSSRRTAGGSAWSARPPRSCRPSRRPAASRSSATMRTTCRSSPRSCSRPSTR